MQVRYLVLDQNQMSADRAPEVVDMLTNAPHVHFIVRDAAMIEITKNLAKREAAIRATLGMLAAHPERVHVTYNTSECLRTELEIRVSTTNCLMYPAASKFLRQILRALKDEAANGHALQKVLSDREHHRKIARDYFNYNFNKQRLADLIIALKAELTAEQLKALRAGRLSQQERLNMIRATAVSELCYALSSRYKMKPEEISNLIAQKSMLLRYFYLKVWLCMDWLRLGGFEKAETQITDDLLDHEYILTAASFDGLLTRDQKAARAQDELRILLEKAVTTGQPLPT